MRARFVRCFSSPHVAAVAGGDRGLAAQQPTATTPASRDRSHRGTHLDARHGPGRVDVGVQIVGTTLGTLSGVEGRYAVPNVPAGTVTIQVRRIGYAPKTVTGILLDAGQTLEQNITIAAGHRAAAGDADDRRRRTRQRQRGARSAADRHRHRQLGDRRADHPKPGQRRCAGGAAGERRDGAGRPVRVRSRTRRALHDGDAQWSRIPSPEPEKRVVPLDLFPSGLLQTITTSKTFTPDQSGDFSGAQVDIRHGNSRRVARSRTA